MTKQNLQSKENKLSKAVIEIDKHFLAENILTSLHWTLIKIKLLSDNNSDSVHGSVGGLRQQC